MISIIQWVIALTFLFEILTIFGRFVFKISSKKVYIYLMKKLKFRYFVHVHHGIIGLFIIIFSLFYFHSLVLVIGLSLFLSDFIHHFLVLYYIIGDPEFHLLYKDISSFQKEQLNEQRKLKKFFSHIVHHTS